MFKNYLKTALRNLMRNKFYSAINIVGLAIGITACILIMLYVQSENSYDKFHEKADRIYRVNLYAVLSDDNINQPVTNPPLANAMQNEIPEVEEAVRLTGFQQPVLRHNDDSLGNPIFVPASENRDAYLAVTYPINALVDNESGEKISIHISNHAIRGM